MKNQQIKQTWDSLRLSALTILVTLFGVQLLRMLFSSLVGYLRDARGMSSIDLAPLALGIFALSFLAVLPVRLVGLRRALWFSAGGLALLRLAEQVSIQPQLDLVLSAAGTALFLLYLPLAAGIARAKGGGWSSNLTGAFVLGLALDAAVQTATLTLDLSWHPGLVPTLSVAVLSLLLLISIKQQASSLEKVVLTEGSFGRLVPLAAFGPWLLLHLLVFHNLAAVSAHSGLETPLAGGLVILTDALALAVLSWQSRKTSGLVLKTLLAGMALVISLALLQVGGLAAALLLAIGSLSSVLLAGTLLTGALLHHEKSGLWRSSTSLGIGQILFVLLTFLYYLTYDIDLGFRSQVLLPLIGLLVAGFGLLSAWQQGSHPAPQADFQPALACLALLLAPLAMFFLWREPVLLEPQAGNQEIRVMTYNLHNGFNRQGRLDLEALAKTIEDSQAQVVGLQEISRGWLVWGGVDMLAWLSQRLNMAYVSGPTADAQWGNAVLTRYPIVSADLVKLPTDDLLLLRGYIRVVIGIGAGEITFIDTHYHQVYEDSAIRVQQSQALIAGISLSEPTILVGDMNAEPDSAEMDLLAEAGLVESALAMGYQPAYTYPSDQPDRQIDYIWLTPLLAGLDFEVLQTTASDHLPLVMQVELSEGF